MILSIVDLVVFTVKFRAGVLLGPLTFAYELTRMRLATVVNKE